MTRSDGSDGRDEGSLRSLLACADSSFPKLSHETALAVICDLGLPAVDVCVFSEHAHTSPVAVRADPVAAAYEVLPRIERHGLEVADVFLILGFEERAINHPSPEVRAESASYFGPAVEFARLLGAPGITVLPGMPFEGVESEAGLELAAGELQKQAETAGDAGLALSIEPHFESIVATPTRTLQLLERAPDVSLALDLSHFVYQGIPQDQIDPLVPRTRHIHLRQAGPGAMQLPTSEGVIDFPRLWRRLEASGYGGYLTIEYQWEEWLDCNRVDCLSETAELRNLLLHLDGGDEARPEA